MNEIVKIREENGKRAVSAIELYDFLEVDTRFNDWIKRMFEYGFEEGKDFYSILSKTTPKGGRPTTDYALTLDCAKEISMLQRSEKGKQARQYFIEMEKKALAPRTGKELIAQALVFANQILEEAKLENEQLMIENKAKEKQLQLAAPKVELFDAAMSTDSVMLIREAAKLISDMGQNKLFAKLRDDKYLMKNNEPYQRYIDAGYFQIKERVVNTATDNMIRFTTYVTQKGIAHLHQRYGKRQNQLIPFTN